ncbi:hypothetical protein NDU88_006735 [Pleurodeles waltl]|uniref:Uncharacterized protein n=1 Tax=Pleurodeles waltl TaxID=8319 RepID=A0AAV7TYG1_PLEWA|nr:hypothetical protein NDU88_006735 [Pleurodeles waltl]
MVSRKDGGRGKALPDTGTTARAFQGDLLLPRPSLPIVRLAFREEFGVTGQITFRMDYDLGRIEYVCASREACGDRRRIGLRSPCALSFRLSPRSARLTHPSVLIVFVPFGSLPPPATRFFSCVITPYLVWHASPEAWQVHSCAPRGQPSSSLDRDCEGVGSGPLFSWGFQASPAAVLPWSLRPWSVLSPVCSSKLLLRIDSLRYGGAASFTAHPSREHCGEPIGRLAPRATSVLSGAEAAQVAVVCGSPVPDPSQGHGSI